MTAGSGPDRLPWSSEESREFLQERIAHFAYVVFLASLLIFVSGWMIDLVWYPGRLAGGLPLTAPYVFNLGWAAVLLAMWLATRGAPVPGSSLRHLDAAGTFCVSAIALGQCFSASFVLRPDILAVVALFMLLLYRAAVVPSDVRRTAWIGTLCAAPLPVLTYLAYSRVVRPASALSPSGYAAYSFRFSVLVVLLSCKTSSVIYGLRRTIRERRHVGPYTLVSKIGEGGMGAVYRAQHVLLRRPTAIKVLQPERAREIDLARFEREVQMTSLLTSPHTVSIYDFGRTPDGLFYYAMEYLDGIDLQELVSRDGPMPPGRVVRVLRQVCEALGEVHGVGLIHRDVKPANILLCQRGGRSDVVKVVDFGLVKDLAATAGPGVTRENIVLGTPHYLSPEALQSPETIDARSDIYALGATAYFLLTGTPVFDGPLPQIFAQHIGTASESPAARLGRPVPPSLETLILSALAKDPNERPESAEAFGAQLAACPDVPEWTQADATAWWRTRGARILANRAGAPVSSLTTRRTLEIGRARTQPPPAS